MLFLPQVVYEFVFGSGKAGNSFSLFTCPPKKVVPLSETCSLQEYGLTVPTIVIVEESDQNVAEILFPSDTSVVCSLIKIQPAAAIVVLQLFTYSTPLFGITNSWY